MSEYAALDKLARALNPLPGAAVDGPHQASVTGTVNIVGGGSGGTSMTDNNAFTPGSTSITPMGGYYGGRTVNSGNAAAVAIDHSGNLQVNVVAGGAGGGIANISVRGTANSDLHVGYASGANFNQDGGAYLPILGTVNLGAGAAPYASVAVYGSPANPVYVSGSVNVSGSLGVWGSMGVGQIGAPWSVTGSMNVSGSMGVWGSMSVLGTVNVSNVVTITGTVNTTGGGGGFASAAVYGSPANPVYNVGSVNVVNAVGIYGSVNTLGTTTLGAIPTVWLGGIGADTVNSALRVNVVAGGAGGGVANLTVQGTANTAIHVGFASGANAQTDGGAAIPVNIVAGAAGGFATLAVYGSPAFPVYAVGSMNVSGSLGVWGSMGVGQIGAPWSVTGSMNVSGSLGVWGSMTVVGSVNITGSLNPVGVFGSMSALASLAGVTANGSLALDVDPRANLTMTQFIISNLASGQFNVAPTAPASQRVYFSSYHLVATGTIDGQWMSPSGVAISGSFRILPGAGFAIAGAVPNGPVLMGSLQSGIFFSSQGTQNIGGVAIGWVGT